MTSRATTAMLLLVLLVGDFSAAHTRSESYSHWHLSGSRIVATVTVPLREVMVLYENEDASTPARELLQRLLQADTSVSASGEDCARTGDNILQSAPGFIRVELQFDCVDAAPDMIHYRTMFDQAPAHVHYAKLHVDGALAGEALLTDTADTWNISAVAVGSTWTFLSFVEIGMQHIAGGIDHIAFLFGLLLVAGSAGRAVIAVTGFTLGHSISLAATVLGYIGADSQLVEAFIGFTILLVAVEFFLSQHNDTTRFAVASCLLAWFTGLAALSLGFIEGRAFLAYLGFGIFSACYLLASPRFGPGRGATRLLFVATGCFGLVHGFGFAGFLMETGLLGTSLLVPLLGFNLGVELGQLVLVSLAVLSGWLLRNQLPRVLPQLLAAGLCGIGVFWFVGRTLA